MSTPRHYDKVGSLRPAAVDAHTGYRHYTTDQVPTTVKIVERTEALARLDALTEADPGVCCRVELPVARVPGRTFTAKSTELTGSIVRGIAALRTRLRRDRVRVTGWGALLPLDLDDRVTGHVFARTDSASAARSGQFESLVLPTGPAMRTGHVGHHGNLALGHDAVLAEIDRIGAHPAGPVVEDYPVRGVRGTPATVCRTVPIGPAR